MACLRGGGEALRPLRPTYPDRLIDDLVALAGLGGAQSVLEVGAGTGKATVMFAARGILVVAIEPSPAMVAGARRNCGAYLDVKVEQDDFEQWDPGGRRFPLVFSAQAWHCVQPAAGFATAREALLEDGVLGASWNRVAWESSDVREALLGAYQQAAPELAADSHMLHPANLRRNGNADSEGDIAAVEGLADAEIRDYEWDLDCTAADFVGLLATLSQIRVMTEARRSALLAAVAAVIEAHGEPLTLPMRTRLCLARRR